MLSRNRTVEEHLAEPGDLHISRAKKGKVVIFGSCLALSSIVLLFSSFLLFTTPQKTHAQSSGTRPALGVNLGADAQLFTDAMKTARPTWDMTGDGDCPLDANGWPTKDCGVYVWEGQANNDGTYKLIFNGQADVNVSLGYATVSNKQYDASSNTTTATLTVTDTGAENFHLNFTNTQRDANSATNTGVTNVQLFKPTSEGSSTPFDSSQIFTPWYKQALAPYDYLRFMAGTNWNKSTNWSDRTTVNYSTQRKILPGESNFEGNLMAFEYMVELANETGKDLYVVVPDRATDDYVTKLAQLILYGSDGTNPYTSTQSNPVWKPLNSNLNVYVEYTNEAWNFVFDQAHDIADAATAEVQNNPGSPLSYDGNTNSDVIRYRYYARRAMQVSSLFRSVFGDSAMLTRVRPLLEWQYANLNSSAEDLLLFLNDYYNNADGVQHVSNPHPVSYSFWGAGGAVYYHSNNDNASTVDGIYNSGIPSDDYRDTLDVESLWAHAYGLHFMAYEGGFAVGGDGPTAVGGQSRWDPRAKQSMIDSFNDFAAAGGDAYTTGTYAQWNDVKQASTAPLVQAAATITGSSFAPAAIDRGQVIDGNNPTIIAGPHYDVARSWPQGPVSNLGKEVNYLLRVSSAGTYQVTVNVGNTASGGSINVYVDGALLGNVSVPNGSNQSVVVGSLSLSSGLHGVILRPSANASNNSAGTINALIIQPNTGTPPALPTPGALPSGWQSQDIGSVGQAGSASFENNSTFKLISSGGDISNSTDQFRFAYQQVSGNGSIVARVAFESDANDYAKAGVMIRETLDGGSTHASTFLFGGSGSVLNDRTTTGGSTSQAGPIAGHAPYWVKIERSGSTFTSSVSVDGTNWKQVGTATISMADTIYVGLAYSAHDNSVLAAADFDNVSVTGFSGVQNLPTPTPTATSTPTGSKTYVSDLNWTSATTGYGSVQKDKSVNGNTITLNGTTYSKGLGVHAISEIHYALNGAYSTFISDVGVDDESWGGSVQFQVYGDGVKLFDSGIVHKGDTIQHISVNVSGVQDLELYVGDGGDGISNDHADWAGAYLQ